MTGAPALPLRGAGPIRGLLFDHDGTLVDSVPAVHAATNRVLARAGLPVIDAESVVTGMALPTGPRMGAHAGIGDPLVQASLAAAFHQEIRSLATVGCAMPYAGILQAISGAHARGVRLGVVSNNDGDFVRRVLGSIGLEGWFRCIYGEADVPAPKPSGEGLIQAARCLGLPVEACCYVGDGAPDLAAARAAGMAVIGVTWGLNPRQVLAGMGFDRLIDHPGELEPAMASLS